MAILHKATVRPTKRELLERIVGKPATVLGTYRFDDPAGEVGVEAFVVRAGGTTRHVVLTYRGEPLEGAETDLISTMEHSVLGRRWIYDGTSDPVAVACFRRALRGEQDQAVEEIWDSGHHVGTREQTVQLSVVPGQTPAAKAALDIAIDLGRPPVSTLGPQLRATWDGGAAIVASLG